MKLSSPLLALAVALFVPLSSCEGGGVEGEGEGGGREGEGEGEGDDVDVLVDAFETFLDECELFGPLERYEPLLFAPVRAQFSRAELEAGLERDLANPAVSLNREELAACLDELASCAPVFGANQDDTACGRLFDGLREAGQGCASSTECVGALVCDSVEVCGVCVEAPGDGDNCDVDPDPEGVVEGDCADGLVCVESFGDAVAVCRPPLDAGDACDFDADACDDGFSCDGDPAVCIADNPAPEFEAGDACTTTCGGITKGLSCENEVCAVVGVAQPGDACDPDLQNPAVWCVNFVAGINFCVPTQDDPEIGICTALPGPGSPCIANRCNKDTALCNDAGNCVAPPGVGQECVNNDCAEGLLCDGGVDPPRCVNAPTDGQACIDGDCADDHVCNADVCAALPGLGAACPDDECADDLDCRAGVCVADDDPLICAE